MAGNAFDVLEERGFVEQVTDRDALRRSFGESEVTVYVGYDPTAPSLHVGHLLTLMALKHLGRAGHRPIAVLGGGTARVGDPSGKTEMRQMLSEEEIQRNLATMGAQIQRLLGSAGESRVINNADWLLELKYIDFLREIGRHFSVNRMLAAEAYRQRMERGLSFIEFNYQLLQAYDFLQLQQRYGCSVQIGGDDQWGNIVAGVDLCRRVARAQTHGLTLPLLLTATGQKMGKTAAGAVWLDAEMLSPYDYYQYWVNSHDADVRRYLAYFTLLPMEEIRAVENLTGAALNACKSILAYEATKIAHGAEQARRAHTAAQGAFGGRSLPAQILPSSDVPRASSAALSEIPTTTLPQQELETGVPLLQLLVDVELCKSKNEARRLIRQGAVRVGETAINDENHTVTAADMHEGSAVLRVGKKKVHRLSSA